MCVIFLGRPLARNITSAYGDNTYMASGGDRPCPRKLSNLVFKGKSGIRNRRNLTALFAFFGESFKQRRRLPYALRNPIRFFSRNWERNSLNARSRIFFYLNLSSKSLLHLFIKTGEILMIDWAMGKLQWWIRVCNLGKWIGGWESERGKGEKRKRADWRTGK